MELEEKERYRIQDDKELPAAKEGVQYALEKLYGDQEVLRAMEEVHLESGEEKSPISLTEDCPENYDVEQDGETLAPTVRLVNAIFRCANAESASDVHFEPGRERLGVRMRIDGLLHEMATVPKGMEAAVLSRIKIMAGMDVTRKNLPQDGSIRIKAGGTLLDLRVSSLPTIYGEKIVVRFLHRVPVLLTFEGLGLRGEHLSQFISLLHDTKEGAILLAGPTGSGKTSTMYAILNHLKGEAVNLVSLEDPVEMRMDQICQVQIQEKAGFTFANALRTVLRQDPDVIAVGEIRDRESAEIAMRSALTGHLVFSSLHTYNAFSSIDRLLDLGVEPYVLAGAVRGIVSQRLLRCVCPYCRKSYRTREEEWSCLGFPEKEDLPFYRGEGCEKCFHTGYRGRIGVFEVLPVEERLKQAIAGGSRKNLEEAMKSCRHCSIWENCRELVKEGITTAEEVIRVMGIVDREHVW